MNEQLDNIARQGLLYDFYGQLLTNRQEQILELHVQENFSLSEIAQELGISRQAVHDALRSGQRSLEKYEEKLGLLRRFVNSAEAIESIDGRILALIEGLEKEEHREKNGKRDHLIGELKEIKAIIDGLEE